jgi:hypothetical protein
MIGNTPLSSDSGTKLTNGVRTRSDDLPIGELKLTMDILFGFKDTFTKSQERATRQAYGKIVAPVWILPLLKNFQGHWQPQSTNFHGELDGGLGGDFSARDSYLIDPPRMSHILKQYPPFGLGGMKTHLSYKLANPRHNWSYADFPYYGERLRILRE